MGNTSDISNSNSTKQEQAEECVDVFHYHGICPSSVSGVDALKGNVDSEVFCPSIGLDLN